MINALHMGKICYIILGAVSLVLIRSCMEQNAQHVPIGLAIIK